MRGFRVEETDEQVGSGGDHPRRADLDTDLRRRIYGRIITSGSNWRPEVVPQRMHARIHVSRGGRSP